ncbi:hypothetical protein B0H19DRAFT_1277032 [Mycena capillaripes]|nr:hypothetical protein B0H19DRAFT_1277032 [Mycena capillaripes]
MSGASLSAIHAWKIAWARAQEGEKYNQTLYSTERSTSCEFWSNGPFEEKNEK